MQVNLMTRPHCGRNCFDNIVSLEVFVIPDSWSDRKLQFHDMLASRTVLRINI